MTKPSLRAAYRKANPLGGPAKMFRAIAERLEAGEDYWAVMQDYGIMFRQPRRPKRKRP
ncbi:MAG: hypothetical protein ACRD3M_18740 [Thermoanaerobaculia bacterium]